MSVRVRCPGGTTQVVNHQLAELCCWSIVLGKVRSNDLLTRLTSIGMDHAAISGPCMPIGTRGAPNP
jgi:hypothetical protein